MNLHPQLRKVLIPIQKTGGRFRITPTYRFVTRLEKTKDGWAPFILANSTRRSWPRDPMRQ